MGSATVTAKVLATGEKTTFEVISYVPASSIEIIDEGSKDLIFPSNSVDILDESIYKRQLSVNVVAINGEKVPADYIGKYSSSIIWSSNDAEALSAIDGFIEARGKASDAVIVSATSNDNTDVSDSIEYAITELDITVNGTRTNGGTFDIVTHAFSAGTYTLSLYDESGKFTSEYMASNEFSGLWTMTNDYTKGEIPENKDIFGTDASYLKLTNKTDFTATISRYSQLDTPVVCNIISLKTKPVAIVHFTAGYDYKFLP